jgi:biotin transport system substrate-specific component
MIQKQRRRKMPKEKKWLTTKELVLCALFAALTAIGANITVPAAVPFTLQTLFVVMAGQLCGSKVGAVSATLYMMLGLFGFPVFAGYKGGLHSLVSPSFGYIIAFIPSAFIAGIIVEKMRGNSLGKYALAGLVSTLVTYVIGTAYLFVIMNLYLHKPTTAAGALTIGVIPFIPTTFAKLLISTLLSMRLRPVLVKMGALTN